MRRRGKGHAGFTLIELLVVMGIIALLAAVSLPALRSLNGAGKFGSSVERIAGILDQARSYATGQNTHVWVVFYPVDPSRLPNADKGGDQLYVATYASADGTSQIDWSQSPPSPSSFVVGGAAGNPEIVQVSQVRVFKQLHLVTDSSQADYRLGTLPASLSVLTATNAPATNVKFSLVLHSPLLTLSSQPAPAGLGQNYVIEFTPSGAVQVSSGLSSWVGFDLQPMKGPGARDADNVAAVRINGLTGTTTVFRK